MIKFEKIKSSISKERKNEHMAAELEKQKALLEYVAIMADVELPDEEEQNGTQQEL